MKYFNLFKNKAINALILVIPLISSNAHSAAISTGPEELLWPAIIITSPFLLVKNIFTGSDASAIKSMNQEASKILEQHKEKIPVKGLYTGSLDLTNSLFGLFAESGIPLIEVSTEGSAWLLSQTHDPRFYIEQATQHKYIRLSFGQQGDFNCLKWKNSTSFTDMPPVRPGTCLLAEFDNRLESDVAIKVDTKNIDKRKLEWNLINISTNDKLFSIPFWQTQQEDKPLALNTNYREANENNPFTQTIKKLLPQSFDKKPYKSSFLLNKITTESNNNEKLFFARITSDLTPPEFDWREIQAERETQDWKEGYARAYARNLPTIVNNGLLLVPTDDTYGKACASPENCTFAKNFVSKIGVLTTNYQAASPFSTPYTPGSSPASAGHEMYITLFARTFKGEQLWALEITPTSLPDKYSVCKDFSRGCYFYPDLATISSEKIIIRGALRAGINSPTQDLYELNIPLTSLPFFHQ